MCAVTVPEISDFELWHRRLGHPSDRVVKLVPTISSSTSRKKLNKACEVCPQAKQKRDSFPVSDSKASRIFEFIHCDLWGPNKIPSSCGAHYFLTLVDDFSRAVWVYLFRSKTQVYQVFCSFFAMIARQFETHVKIVRSDNGTEFKCMLDYFDTHGIIFQTSCVGTPQQNGRVERKHQHILNVGRALMFQGNLPITFWGECVLGAVYLINRTPSGLLHNTTPFEILFGQAPEYDELKVFGCLAFAHNQKAKGNKFAPRSRKCVFIGYPHGKKGWKLNSKSSSFSFLKNQIPSLPGWLEWLISLLSSSCTFLPARLNSMPLKADSLQPCKRSRSDPTTSYKLITQKPNSTNSQTYSQYRNPKPSFVTRFSHEHEQHTKIEEPTNT